MACVATPLVLQHQTVTRLRAENGDTRFSSPWAGDGPLGIHGATAVALAAILLRPAGMSEHDQFLNEAVASHVRSLMANHLTGVTSSNQHTVKPWFNGKLDFAPGVKDFAEQGFPLVGGRLDYLSGRTVAALVYRRNNHLINVFVWPAASAGREPAGPENSRGYFVVDYEAGGLHYCLVSDLNVRELAQLANLFGQ